MHFELAVAVGVAANGGVAVVVAPAVVLLAAKVGDEAFKAGNSGPLRPAPAPRARVVGAAALPCGRGTRGDAGMAREAQGDEARRDATLARPRPDWPEIPPERGDG